MGNNISNLSMPAILLVAFNRPKQLSKILEIIRSVQPRVLYVACDGPRPDNPNDVKKTSIVREMVNSIDWCESVNKKFSTENLGSGIAVSQAITWFLGEVGEGIILEDDCLPDSSFFFFCAEMLERYRYTSNIMQISGFNLLSDKYALKTDYLFSNFGWSWGWATWQRAWRKFDFNMSSWTRFKNLGLHKKFPFYPDRVDTFDAISDGRGKMWDYKWAYAIAINSGLSIVPTVNLIRNIGFTKDATHPTSSKSAKRLDIPSKPLSFPLNHPEFLYPDINYDKRLIHYVHNYNIYQRILIIGSRLKRRILSRNLK